MLYTGIAKRIFAPDSHFSRLVESYPPSAEVERRIQALLSESWEQLTARAEVLVCTIDFYEHSRPGMLSAAGAQALVDEWCALREFFPAMMVFAIC